MDAQPGGLTDLSLVRALGDLNTIFFSATSVMTAVFTAALGWAMLRGRARHPLARLDHPRRGHLQLHLRLDRRHLQQLPRPRLAHHRLGLLCRLPRRHAHPQRHDAADATHARPPSRRPPLQSSCSNRPTQNGLPPPTVRPYGIDRPQCSSGSSRRRPAFPPESTAQSRLRQGCALGPAGGRAWACINGSSPSTKPPCCATSPSSTPRRPGAATGRFPCVTG